MATKPVEPEERDPLIERWLATMGLRSKNTRRAYRNAMRALLRHMRPTARVSDITLDELAAAANQWDMERDPGTQHWNNMVSAWRCVMRFAIGQRERDDNPAVALPLRRVNHDIPRPCPSRDELRAIWRTITDKDVWARSNPYQRIGILRDRAILALLVGCGLRNAEVCALKRRNFHTGSKARYIVCRRKGRDDQRVPWPAAADRYLEPVLAPLLGDDVVFRDDRQNPLRPPVLNCILAGICEAAGVRYYSAHAFRRFSITDVSERLGQDRAQRFAQHASVETTHIYDQRRFVDAVTGELYDEGDSGGATVATTRRG